MEKSPEILKKLAPLRARARLLSSKRRLMPSAEAERNCQQTELLKWEQEMFHRVFYIMCLVEEGLVDVAEWEELRKHILRSLINVHPNGEWGEFTRDKLIFLQDLLHARCISEDEYHATKKPIMNRLAQQGAEIDMEDITFKVNEMKDATEARIALRRRLGTPPHTIGELQSPASGSKKKTPMKHVMDAMGRMTSKKDSLGWDGRKKISLRVPHALDFLRPADCPVRDAPYTPVMRAISSEESVESPLFKEVGSTRDLLPELSNLKLDESESPLSVASSPCPASTSKVAVLGHSKSLVPSKLSFTSRAPLTSSKSSLRLGCNRSESKEANRNPPSPPPKGETETSLGRKLFNFLRGWQKAEPQPEPEKNSDQGKGQLPLPKFSWKRLESLVKKPKLEDDFGKPTLSDRDRLLTAMMDYPVEKMNFGFIHGQGPDTKKLSKTLSVRQAPTNFFIDQVVGENIKIKLACMREEMAPFAGNENITNEQIDTIAMQLPVDKNELMRCIPKCTCDRLGELILDIVHTEFKSHVSEMDGMRKTANEKRQFGLKFPMNDENSSSDMHSRSNPQSSEKPSLRRVNTTGGHVRNPAKPSLTRVYTTEGSRFKGASIHHQHADSYYTAPPAVAAGEGRAVGVGYEELDVKLGAEILRMPFRNFNETIHY